MNRRKLIIGALATTVLTAAPAMAQTAPTTPPATDAAPLSAPAPQSADDGSSVEDIVVTAQRRSENLQRVPITITALSPRNLSAGAIDGTLQLQRVAPGIVGLRIGASFQPFVRGIGTNQTAQGSESSVATYVDGVYQGFKAGNLFDFNGIERIEVLKGPQGTLFGRNATGGAISIITRDPSTNQGVEGEIGYGRFNEFRGKLYAAGNITDTLSASVAFSGRKSDGYLTDPFRGKNSAPFTSTAVLGKLRWAPTSGFVSTLSGGYGYFDDPTGVATHSLAGTVPQSGAASLFGDDQSATSLADPLNKIWNWRATWDNRVEIGSLDFVSITGYIQSKLKNFTDNDASTANLAQIVTTQYAHQFSQEFQLQSNKNKTFTWIIGAFYLRYHDFYGDRGDNNWSTQSNVPGIVRPADLQVAGASITGRSTGVYTTSYSGFAEGKVEFAQDTHLTLGLRYTSETKRLNGIQYAYTAVAGTTAQNFGLMNGVLGNDGLVFGRTINGTVDLSKKFSKLTWRAVLDHNFTEDVMAYASVSRGFKSGGFNPSIVSNNQAAVSPEVLDTYEIGFKSQLFDRRVRFNASAFYNSFKDIQVALINTTGSSITQNAGAARMYGIDVDFEWVPVNNLTLRAAANYLDAKYTKFPAAQLSLPRVTGFPCVAGAPLTLAQAQAMAAAPQTGGNCQILALDAKGLPMIYAPKFTLNVAANYDIELPGGSKVNLNASYYHNSGFDFAPGGLFAHVGAFGTLALSAGWTAPDDRYNVRVWADNVTNDRYARIILPAPQTFWTVTSQPVTYGITLGFKFGGK